MIARVRVKYRSDAEQVEANGAVAIITAGPPGAGKSTAMHSAGTLDGYLRIDPDESKDLLLDEAFTLRMLGDADGITLADGRPVMVRELSARVHMASTTVCVTKLRRWREHRGRGHPDLGGPTRRARTAPCR